MLPPAPPREGAEHLPPRAHRIAPIGAAAALLALYAATLAPDVTFWDAGELAAAAHVLGIPHPPGTPLWIAIAHLWARALAAPGLDTAVALNALSAVATAAAAGVTAWLVGRWRGGTAAGVAAAIGAGGMATVWLDATETEVYAMALLLGVVALACAERRGAGGDARWLVASAYCLGLAGPLHLSALVVAPAVIVLAARRDDGSWRVVDAVLLAGAATLALGLGSASPWAAVAGAALLLVAGTLAGREPPLHARTAALAGAAVLLAASAAAIMLVRARHDPLVNQGDPSTLARFVEVLARRQYAVAPLWPRQAPVWLQLANLLQYADAQVALGLASRPTFAPARTVAALLWAVLAFVGAREHRRTHARSWLALLALLVGGSLGVAVQLNLKAGPTIGWGILPDDAPHEARERDYFFTFAWWTWGAWAGMGAAVLARRLRRPWIVAACALPVALNWAGVTRRRQPEASLAARVGRGLLLSAPRGAVLLARGDNDSYPLWYQQVVHGLRPDVTVVTVPLLGGTWYRAELARRHRLLGGDEVPSWRGETAAIRAIVARAAAAGRPVAATASTLAAERAPIGGGWRLQGLVWVRDSSTDATRIDTAAARAVLPFADGVALPDTGVSGGLAPAREPVGRWARRLLNCPAAVVRGTDAPMAAQLDSLCNVR